MKTIGYLLLAGLLAAGLAACGTNNAPAQDTGAPPAAAVTEETPPAEADPAASAETEPSATEAASSDGDVSMEEQEEEPIMTENTFYVQVGGSTFSATFADTAGAQALKDLLTGGDLTVQLSDYGGFEKVGPLGRSLPTSNSQTTTQAGDIVLYQGNQIVLFYGSNSWSYTRLGRIDDLTGWAEALGGGSITVTLSLQGP